MILSQNTGFFLKTDGGMKAAIITLLLLAFGSSLLSAWDEDPRCRRRRELRQSLAANNRISDQPSLDLTIQDQHDPYKAVLKRSLLEDDETLLRELNTAIHTVGLRTWNFR